MDHYVLNDEEYIMLLNDDIDKYVAYIVNNDKLENCKLKYRKHVNNIDLLTLCYELEAWKIIHIILLRGCRTNSEILLNAYDYCDDVNLRKLICNTLFEMSNDGYIFNGHDNIFWTFLHRLKEFTEIAQVSLNAMTITNYKFHIRNTKIDEIPTLTSMTLKNLIRENIKFKYVESLEVISSNEFSINLPMLKHLILRNINTCRLNLPNNLKSLVMDNITIDYNATKKITTENLSLKNVSMDNITIYCDTYDKISGINDNITVYCKGRALPKNREIPVYETKDGEDIPLL